MKLEALDAPLAEQLSRADAGQLLAVMVMAAARLLSVEPAPTQRAPLGGRAIGVAEAAERLGMSKGWLYEHAAELPFCRRMGRSLRFDSAGLNAWLEERNRG